MGAVYTRCESDVTNLVARVMKGAHIDLHRAGVLVDCCFAEPADGVGAAVMLHGYACAAVVKKISYKQRVLGRGDAEITIDKSWWDDAHEKQKLALIDHELTHLVLVIDSKTDLVKRDRAGRPRLAMRLHDWEMGGFEEVAQRHGHSALEVLAMRNFDKRYGQLCFDWAKNRVRVDPTTGEELAA